MIDQKPPRPRLLVGKLEECPDCLEENPGLPPTTRPAESWSWTLQRLCQRDLIEGRTRITKEQQWKHAWSSSKKGKFKGLSGHSNLEKADSSVHMKWKNAWTNDIGRWTLRNFSAACSQELELYILNTCIWIGNWSFIARGEYLRIFCLERSVSKHWQHP